MSLVLFDALFGSKARARVLRFFLLNPDSEYTAPEVAQKTLVSRAEVSRELKKLARMKFVTEKTRKAKKCYKMNELFPFYPELKRLAAKLSVHAQSQIFRKLKTVGEVKAILISGVFLNYPKSKVDMILVVNHPNRAKLRQAIAYVEAEVGKEVSFVLVNNEELHYRLNMLDRFLIEFLEGPHEEVVNKVVELKRFVAGLQK